MQIFFGEISILVYVGTAAIIGPKEIATMGLLSAPLPLRKRPGFFHPLSRMPANAGIGRRNLVNALKSYSCAGYETSINCRISGTGGRDKAAGRALLGLGWKAT